MQPRSLSFRQLFLLAVLAWLAVTAFAQQPAELPRKRVLLISTGSRLSPGFNIVDQQVQQELRKADSLRIEVYAENLDVVRFPAERSQRVFREYLAARYAEQPPDLVVLAFVGNLGKTALSLTQLFPGVPILVVGFTEEAISLDGLGGLVTGFVQRADARGALELISRLQPDRRRVIVIGGVADDDRKRLARVRAAAAELDGKLSVEIRDDLTMAELPRAVSAMPPDSAVLYVPMFRDAAGQTVISAQVGRSIAEAANVPVYVMVDGSFGTGAVGGTMTSVEAFGRRAGERARLILTGTAPASLPFEVRSDSVPTFDWRALQRWKIAEESLPAGSVVRFKPVSLWREYSGYIIAAVLTIVLQAATIGALVLERRYRRRIDARRERAEVELGQRARELAHVGRVSLMGQLAASLAHELSQPLTAIFGNATAALLSLDAGRAGESRRALKDLLKDQERAAEVVRHMRRFVKKEAGAPFVALDLSEVIADVVALVRADAVAQRVEIHCWLDADLPAVKGDRIQLQQVLLNLLLNALDAMRASDGAKTVDIASSMRDGLSCVAVADRGRGLEVEEVERVFEPFYSTKSEGLGMGLSICRAIVRAHGGDLWAENNAHGGATFLFTLPTTNVPPAA